MSYAATRPLLSPGRDRDYAAVKAEFERDWFKVSYPAFFVQIKFGDIRMMNFASAKHNARHITFEEVVNIKGREQIEETHFFSRWVEDLNHRVYDSMDFLPPPLVVRCDVYNTFPGLRAASLPDVEGERDLSPILDLIYDLCDREEAPRQYLLRYMADVVQFPGRLPKVGIIMKSKQGRGKSTLWGSFFAQKILGEDLYTSSANPRRFFGKFANGMVNKLLCNFNEVSISTTNKILGLVKEAITEPVLNYEKKGHEVVKVHNCARQVWFSNENMPMKIAQDDRRWVAVQASDRMHEVGTPEHTEYFRRLHWWIADDANARAFYDMLMAIDLSEWNAERDRPRTSFYLELQRADNFWWTEHIVREYAKTLTNVLPGESSPAWLRQRRFDIQCTSIKLFIEVDGDQHFKNVARFPGSVQERQKVDVWKMKQAIRRGSSIIRLAQKDVVNDTIDWKSQLRNIINDNSGTPSPSVWYLARSTSLYNAHRALMS